MKRTRSRRDRESELNFIIVQTANKCRSGGVSIVGGSGKIDINNTFDERLKLLEVDALPMVRTSLFGKNENRKFHD